MLPQPISTARLEAYRRGRKQAPYIVLQQARL
jgi:hypothetical protein